MKNHAFIFESLIWKFKCDVFLSCKLEFYVTYYVIKLMFIALLLCHVALTWSHESAFKRHGFRFLFAVLFICRNWLCRAYVAQWLGLRIICSPKCVLYACQTRVYRSIYVYNSFYKWLLSLYHLFFYGF